jgi:hypothetical protein
MSELARRWSCVAVLAASTLTIEIPVLVYFANSPPIASMCLINVELSTSIIALSFRYYNYIHTKKDSACQN